MSNQPVNQIATNKTTRVHPQVISPIFDHNRVFFSVQPVPQMLPDQYDLQRFQRELVCHFLRVNKWNGFSLLVKQDTFQFKTKQPGAQPSRLSSRQILVSQHNRFGSSLNALPREGMSVAWWDKNGYVPINFWNNKSINKPLLSVSDLQVPQTVLLLMPVKFYKSHQLFPFPPFFCQDWD